MKKIYSNVPLQDNILKIEEQKFFDSFYTNNVSIDGDYLRNLKSYFQSKGFGDSSAESIATILIYQCAKDEVNPMKIIDTLQGLDSVQLSALVAEILNYNRYKSSILGFVNNITPAAEIQRNILP